MRLIPSLLVACSLTAASGAERINHEGRILGAAPVVTTPTQFNTTQADAIVSALQIMPRDSAWNEDISGRPVAANSAAMIANIRDDLFTQLLIPPPTPTPTYPNRQRLVVFEEMNYVLVPDSQPLVGIRFITYPGDSDFNGGTNPVASWPVPSIMPIETWPTGTGSQTLTQWQQSSVAGDRHSIIVQPGTTPRLFETWQAQLTGNTPNWQASNGATFPLDSNAPRPAGFTSGDAAGLPMFPALVRYDECQRGVVEHAMRIVVKRSRQNYIYPASHQAGSIADANYPSMGQRLRLRSSFTIPGTWTAQERAVAVALQKYGAFVADNGGYFSVSICPDDRWPANCWDHFTTGASADILDVNQFEVITTTGAIEGPRSAGAPTCNAGPDQGVTIATGAILAGSATGSGLTTLWEVYPTPAPPGTVTFTNVNANSLTPTATFSAVGTYTLRLKVSDGTHTPAYDAVVITVAGDYPAPALSSINPTTRVQNGGAFTLILNGSNFVPASQVAWTGRANLTAASVNGPGTQLTVAVPASYLSSAGNPTITVFNPTPGGGTSTGQILGIAADVTAPVISAVAAGSITTSVATITWTTNEGASSQVDYGLTAGYGSSSALDSTMVTSHARSLSGLAAGTLYHFRVRSNDGSNPAASGDFTFTTTSVPPVGGGGGAAGGGSGSGGCGLGGAVAALLALGALWSRRLR